MKIETKVIREIENLINNNPNYWDFKGNSERNHIHKLIKYPATMVPLMQSKLIELFVEYDNSINNFMDPFMGSGTTIVEANLKGLNTIGIDINPFAYLITLVKMEKIDLKDLEEKINDLIGKIEIENDLNYCYWFPKIDKWFKEHIIYDLSLIKKNILEELSIAYRNVMWVAFARTIQAVSNDRESTFKLHAKSKEEVKIFSVNTKETFKRNLLEIKELFNEYYNYYNNEYISELYCGDSIDIMKEKIADNSVDIISTSPPYGDNATTVTYGQYSMLQLRWIQIEDLRVDINKNLLKNYSSIDRHSLGGINYLISDIENSGILNRSKTLSMIYYKLKERDEKKARKVGSFYIDYEITLQEMFRVLKKNKYLILTVGNRKVDDEIVFLDKVTIELCKYFSGTCVYKFERNILNKRMPNKVSRLKNNKSVNSMKKETILIFIKN